MSAICTTAADDAAAVAGAGLDDGEFATLVERHRPELIIYCRRMLRSPERAEDAVQEALLRAWRARRTFGGRAPFAGWLRRIATNVCLDEIRRASSGPVVPLLPETDPPAPPSVVPDAVLDAGQALAGAMRGIVGVLPPRQRAVLVLRGVLDVPASETAVLLGMSVASVNSALQRARATLRASSSGPATGGTAVLDRSRPSGARGPERSEGAMSYVAALARDDVAGVVALARADAARCGDVPRLRPSTGAAPFAGRRCRVTHRTGSR